MPIYSAMHFFIAYALYGLLWCWADGPGSPSNWVVMPMHILFRVMTPFMYLLSLIDRFIAVPNFWYMPVSFIVSAIAWWTLIVWFITTHPRGKGAA